MTDKYLDTIFTTCCFQSNALSLINKTFFSSRSLEWLSHKQKFVNAFLQWPNNICTGFFFDAIFIQSPLVWSIGWSFGWLSYKQKFVNAVLQWPHNIFNTIFTPSWFHSNALSLINKTVISSRSLGGCQTNKSLWIHFYND